MRTLAIANQKGGVGKTAIAANLGAALADRGHRVLLVDLDFNAALSSAMGYELAPDDSQIMDVLDPDVRAPLAAVIRPTRSPNVDIAPAEIGLSVLEARLPLSMAPWPSRLQEALADVESSYDAAVVDTHPSIGPFLTQAVVAADLIVAPVQTHHQPRRALALLEDHVRRLRQRNALPDVPLWVVRTLYRRGVAHDTEISQILAEQYRGRIFRTVITMAAVHADTSVPRDGGAAVVWDHPGHPSAAQYAMLTEEVEGLVFAQTISP